MSWISCKSDFLIVTYPIQYPGIRKLNAYNSLQDFVEF